jgi:SLOG cluster2/TIR domain
MSNPVRIYVLHHPASLQAQKLTDYIYDWFRLPSLEGVPVYLRSAPAPGERWPALPKGDGVLEYLIPLVDAHLVRDVAWHDYLGGLAQDPKCLDLSANGTPPTEGWVMFPVALDGSAYNLPATISKKNFIRHPSPAGGLVSEEEKRSAFQAAVQETLRHLTEALGRDLNVRLFPKQAGQKLKIFISYARADGTEAPKKLRDFIQGQTQCSAFFDENDISFGESFSKVLEEGVGEKARALIVVGGDHYADRPWCRWEIGRFMQPDPVPLDPQHKNGRQIEVFHPVLVLDTTEGHRMSRVIPELGQVPSTRWAPGKELLAFSLLMREAFFGARNVLEARSRTGPRQFPPGPVVNRLPGPVVLLRLLNKPSYKPPEGQKRIHVNYPGNGLPLMELRLLQSAFHKGTSLTAFRDVSRHLPASMEKALTDRHRPLDGKVLAISFSVSAQLAELGYLRQHLDEAIIYLLRPLLRLGLDLLYAGLPPKEVGVGPMASPDPSAERNMTMTLLNLLNDERSAGEINSDGSGYAAAQPRSSRLYNPAAWPTSDWITAEDEAAWINTCSILRVLPADAGLSGRLPDQKDELPRYLAFQAIVLSAVRQLLARGFPCPVPGVRDRQVRPEAFVFIGGKMTEFFGSIPGIMEEFLRAAQQKIPIYLFGGLGGAARAIADALLSDSSQRPSAFTTSHYTSSRNPNYRVLLEGFDKMNAKRLSGPEETFGELWEMVQIGRQDGLPELFRNGLDAVDNRKLITTTDTMEAVHLTWKGLGRLFVEKTASE